MGRFGINVEGGASDTPHNLTLVVGSSFKAFFRTSMASLYSPLSERS